MIYGFRLDQKLSRESNSDNDEDDDDNEDEDVKPRLFHPFDLLFIEICFFLSWLAVKPRVLDQIPEKSQRLQMAEQHRLNGNTAFKTNKYQQSIDSYTNSILLDKTNPVVYMNRALACKNLFHSLTSCSLCC